MVGEGGEDVWKKDQHALAANEFGFVSYAKGNNLW